MNRTIETVNCFGRAPQRETPRQNGCDRCRWANRDTGHCLWPSCFRQALDGAAPAEPWEEMPDAEF